MRVDNCDACTTCVFLAGRAANKTNQGLFGSEPEAERDGAHDDIFVGIMKRLPALNLKAPCDSSNIRLKKAPVISKNQTSSICNLKLAWLGDGWRRGGFQRNIKGVKVAQLLDELQASRILFVPFNESSKARRFVPVATPPAVAQTQRT